MSQDNNTTGSTIDKLKTFIEDSEDIHILEEINTASNKRIKFLKLKKIF